jgi:hypothetical protein
MVDEFGDYPIAHHHNVFVNSPRSFFTPITANSVVLTSLNFVEGPLGRYYVPTNSPVLNIGTYASAGSAGLYHQTMTTNQVKDASTRLDIGKHYVAVNSSGIPQDGDSDGIPDYLEDANGNGLADDVTSWGAYNSRNGLTAGSALSVFTPLK